jgi:pimeloyl-ACP methyl ester carboxylesterase
MKMAKALRRCFWVLVILAAVLAVGIVAVRPLRLAAGNLLAELAEPAGENDRAECQTPYGISNLTSEQRVPRKQVVILVHGIFGNGVCTWNTKGVNTGLVGVMRNDPQVSRDYDLLAFGYPSFYLKTGSYSPETAGNNLYRALRAGGYLDKYDKIVFVAHSMGGLVAMEAMSKHPDLFDKVAGVFALAVPFYGAEIASWGRMILRNPGLDAMIPIDENEYLNSLHKRFEDADANRQKRLFKVAEDKYKFRFYCGAELGKVAGADVVALNSASARCDSLVNSVANHIDIAKFPDGIPQDGQLLGELKYFLYRHSDSSMEVTLSRRVDLSGSTCDKDGRTYKELVHDRYTLSSPMIGTLFFGAAPDGPGHDVEMTYEYEDSSGKSLGAGQLHPVRVANCAFFGVGVDKTQCAIGQIYALPANDLAKTIIVNWVWSDSKPNAGIERLTYSEFRNTSKYRVPSLEIEIVLPPGIEFSKAIEPRFSEPNQSTTCESPRRDGAISRGRLVCHGDKYILTNVKVEYPQAIPAGSLKCPSS